MLRGSLTVSDPLERVRTRLLNVSSVEELYLHAKINIFLAR